MCGISILFYFISIYFISFSSIRSIDSALPSLFVVYFVMATRIALLIALVAGILCHANGFMAPFQCSQSRSPHGSKDQTHNKHCLLSLSKSPASLSLSLSLCKHPMEVIKKTIRKTKHSLQKTLFPKDNRRMLLGAAILLSMLVVNQPIVVLAMGAVASGGSQGSTVQMNRYVVLKQMAKNIYVVVMCRIYPSPSSQTILHSARKLLQ